MSVTLPLWIVFIAIAAPVLLIWFWFWFAVVVPRVDRRLEAWRDRKIAEFHEREAS